MKIKQKVNRNKFYIVLLIIFLSPVGIMAQDGGFSIGADIYNRYVWRGTDFGASPSIQPGLAYATGNDVSFEIGAWGAMSITGAPGGSELDLYATVSAGMFSFTLTDYFFPAERAAMNNYFEYNEDSTGHVYEPMLGFTGPESFPISVTAALNVYGADPDNSFYFELGYPLLSNVDLFIGGATGSYYNVKDTDFSIVNMGISTSKDIKITENYSLPVSGSFIMNPEAEKVYLLFGFSF